MAKGPGADSDATRLAPVSDGSGLTVIVTSDVPVSAPSLAVNWNTYVPGAEKSASVMAAAEFTKVTAAGPLTWLHDVESLLPRGRPSSVALPTGGRSGAA